MSLVEDFETGTLDPAAFGHREHLFVAWTYLRDLPLEDALARYVRHLRALTVKLGVPQKFHATITWTYLLLLHEAMQREGELPFESLLTRHPELLDKRTLLRLYDQQTLDSAEARARYVLPHQAFTSSKRITRGTPGRLARKRAP